MMGKNPHVSLWFQTVWMWSSPKKCRIGYTSFSLGESSSLENFWSKQRSKTKNTFVAKVPQMPITRLIKDLIHLGVANDRCHTGIPNLNPSKSIRMKSKKTHEILIENIWNFLLEDDVLVVLILFASFLLILFWLQIPWVDIQKFSFLWCVKITETMTWLGPPSSSKQRFQSSVRNTAASVTHYEMLRTRRSNLHLKIEVPAGGTGWGELAMAI